VNTRKEVYYNLWQALKESLTNEKAQSAHYQP